VLGALRSVLFAPEDLALVRGDPGERRRFLDELLVQRAPRYAGVRSDYERVLKQRGALLKSARAHRGSGAGADLRTLDVWDGHLARFGAELVAGRLALIRDLAPHVATAYDEVARGGGPADVAYSSSLGEALPPGEPGPELLEAALLAELARVRSAELERGVTLVGPHRDDLVLSLGGRVAKGYASHGESWSYALALRLASYELLSADGAEPVLVLDDVFAELDTARRTRLAKLAGRAEQVLVTAAVADDVPAELLGARYDVADGQVRRVR
jgi:DNA replication and repair protein RecF